MVLDTQYFGYGCGLVMAGWIIGMCTSYVFSIVRGFRRII